MRSPRRVFPAAALALGAVLALAGCDDGGGDEGESVATSGVDEDGGEGGGEGDDTAQTGGTAAPPTEPMELELVAGERSATEDGSAIRIEGDRAAFVTPSGNMACVLTAQAATCQIFDKTFTPGQGEMVPDTVGACTPAEADAMMTIAESGAWTCVSENLTSAATLSAGGWWVPEVDGDTLEVGGASLAVLPYGQRLQVGPVWCESSDSGVTCANPELDGRRFQLARGSFSYDRDA